MRIVTAVPIGRAEWPCGAAAARQRRSRDVRICRRGRGWGRGRGRGAGGRGPGADRFPSPTTGGSARLGRGPSGTPKPGFSHRSGTTPSVAHAPPRAGYSPAATGIAHDTPRGRICKKPDAPNGASGHLEPSSNCDRPRRQGNVKHRPKSSHRPSVGGLIGQNQHQPHRLGLPVPFSSDYEWDHASLHVQRPKHRLQPDKLALDLKDRQSASRSLPRQDVDRSAIAIVVEAVLDDHCPLRPQRVSSAVTTCA